MEQARQVTFAELPRESLLGGSWERSAFASDNALVTVNWMDPSMPRQPEHHHPFEQISLVCDGVMIFTVHGEEHLIRAGAAILIPANAAHTGWAIGTRTALNIDIYAPPRADYLYLAAENTAEPDSLTSDAREAVEGLLREWGKRLDAGNGVGVVELMSEDGLVDGLGPTRDRSGMTQWAQAREPQRRTKHELFNIRITAASNEEIAASCDVVMSSSTSGRPFAVEFVGRYEDRIVRTPDGYRFRSRSITREGD